MKPKIPQLDLPVAGAVFNLAGERGDDPLRVILEQGRALAKAEAGRRYQESMQLILGNCPGLVSADAPTSEASLGKVVIEPGKVLEARTWLKRRFHVNDEDLALQDFGLCLQIRPRPKRARHHGWPKVSPFNKLEQFQLRLDETSKGQQ